VTLANVATGVEYYFRFAQATEAKPRATTTETSNP
jgi:hypothetical protein